MKIKSLIIAGLITANFTAFAEAPVYDADSMPPTFEAENDQGEYAPPQDDTTFVPMRPQARQVMAENIDSPPPAESMNPEDRIKRLEQQIANMQHNEISAQTESLQSQVQALRGQVEQLTHQLQQMQSAYANVEKRMAEQSNMKAVAAAEPAKPQPEKKSLIAKVFGKSDSEEKQDKQPNVAEEQQIYQTAYTLIKGKKYNEAVTVLQSMLQKYPSGQFASNAHYWLGELYGLLGKNIDALNEFSSVIKNYPDSPRISDAQLKVGLIYASELKWPEAKLAFKKVINRYPGTTSSRLAQEQLKQIKQAGH